MSQRRRWLALLLAMSIACVADAAIPIETLYRSAAFERVVLSPSGKYFATIYSANGTTNLSVVDIAAQTNRALTAFTKPTEVTEVGWDTDDRLIYQFDAVTQYGFHTLNIAAVDRDGKNPIMIADNVGHAIRRFTNEEIVDWTLDDAESVLIASDLEKPGFPSVYKVNTTSAWHTMETAAAASRALFATRRTKIVPSPGRKCTYLTDNAGVVRLCTTLETDGSRQLLYRPDGKSEWSRITGFQASARLVDAVGFTPDNQSLYVLTNRDRDTVALYEMDPASGTLGRLVYEAPDVDLAGAVWSADHRKLLGVRYHTS